MYEKKAQVVAQTQQQNTYDTTTTTTTTSHVPNPMGMAMAQPVAAAGMAPAQPMAVAQPAAAGAQPMAVAQPMAALVAPNVTIVRIEKLHSEEALHKYEHVLEKVRGTRHTCSAYALVVYSLSSHCSFSHLTALSSLT